MLRDLISARKRLALADSDIVMYRVLHAGASWLLDGCGIAEPGPEPYEEWMVAMRFETPKDNVRGSGHTPRHFAAMTGRADLVEALLDRGAPIGAKYKKDDPHFTMLAGIKPLANASTFARDGSIIELLLRRGANPREQEHHFGLSSIHVACAGGNMDGVGALMRHDETLGDFRTHFGALPLASGRIQRSAASSFAPARRVPEAV